MKIKSAQKKEKIQLSKYWKNIGLVGLIAGAFLLGFVVNQHWDSAELFERIKKLTIKTEKALTVEMRREFGLYDENGLATIFLDIPFESLMTIEKKRSEALVAGILLTSDEDYVPAQMHLVNDATFDIKLRLKGDWTDHLESEKWSFRIHIKDDNAAVLGMRRFSLQAPETRNYEKEWGFHQNLFQEGVLTTRYYFVNVVINGEYKGIYALEESFSQDLLEAQGRREGVIIRLNEDLLWQNWENLDYEVPEIRKIGDQIGTFWETNVKNSEITPFRQGRISLNEILGNELITAIELLYSFDQGDLAGEEVFNQELWGKFFAVTDLWGAAHATGWHNLRFYYNPLTGLLEPIAFDAHPFEPSLSTENLAYPFSSQGITQKIFNIPGVQRTYIKTLERITTSTYLAELEENIAHELEYYHEVLSGPLEKGLFGDISALPWEELHQRAFILFQNLESPQPLQSNYQWISIEGEEYLQIDISNLMVVPVKINELVIAETSILPNKTWCVPEGCQGKIIPNSSEFVIFDNTDLKILIPTQELGKETIPEGSFTINANLYGGSYITNNPVKTNYVPQGIDSGVKPSASLEEAIAAHPFLAETGEGLLSVLPGDWDVAGDLVIPENYALRITENTTLRFGEDNILLVHGKLDILGTQDLPVLLTSQEENWSGIVVLGDSVESTWQYVKVEKMSGVSRAGWILTGGITFYQSPLNLTHATIGNNVSEDALNIIQAYYTFDDVEFFNTASDAFDGDFTEGTIITSYFHNIGGDAFDISGSVAIITDTIFTNISDKAISSGEKSILYLENIDIQNVSIGIASKDTSEVSANTINITSANVAGLAAYVKKPQYGPAFIQAMNIQFIDTEKPTLCQLESTIIVDGEEVPKEDIDVEALYAQGLLGK